MGALVTLELPDDSPVRDLPWIITIGPLGDEEEWEPVVVGPYERVHALALAESVVADDELMAVVEPVLPLATVDAIRGEVESARAAGADEAYRPHEAGRQTGSAGAEFADGEFADGEFADGDVGDGVAGDRDVAGGAFGDGAAPAAHRHIQASAPPTEQEVREGFARIAAALARGA